MNTLEQQKLKTLLNIKKIINQIDSNTDALILSINHPNEKVRQLAKESYIQRKINLKKMTNEILKEYE